MGAAILGVIGKIIGPILKFVPFIATYVVGKRQANAEITKETLEKKVEGEKARNEVREELREKSVGEYIRDNDI